MKGKKPLLKATAENRKADRGSTSEFPQSGEFAFTQDGQTFTAGPGEVF